MKNTGKRHLHIVAFATPFPPRYGGVIDVFYKLKALHEQGIRIHLHAFYYNSHPPRKELEAYCEKVTYYPRKTGWASLFSMKPYIIKSRMHPDLLSNLMKDDYPVLFEGLHTCGYIDHPELKNRQKVFRECNIEHHYYFNLARAARKISDKLFHYLESAKLLLFQSKLKYADKITAISKKDTQYLQRKFIKKEIIHMPAFHENTTLDIKPGHGDYALYHGNMSVAENYLAAEYLIREVFSKTDIPFVIAGLNPPQHLLDLAAKNDNISVQASPDNDTMQRLIKDAQVHVLVTFQATGLKLKLLNTLYTGRHVLVNPTMVAGTMVENLCETGNTSRELREKLEQLMKTPVHPETITERKKLLEKHYSNRANAELLIRHLFE